MVVFHNITGSETLRRGQLLPGYAALKIAPPRPWQWSWRLTMALMTVSIAALTIAGTRGLLP
jgi:hypothetical protein